MLDKSIPLPLYFQVKEDILEKIKKSYIKMGELIPSETELQNNYKVSRITIRRAIQELVQEGYLSTQQGKGTYVNKPKASQELNLISSWAETMNKTDLPSHSETISFAEVTPPADVTQALNLLPGEKVYKLERIRYLNSEPICFMINYLIPSTVPGLLERGLMGESLYYTMENGYNLILSRAVETVEAKAANNKEAEFLSVKKGFPLLYATRVTYDDKDCPLEVVITISRCDRYSYKIKLVGRAKK